MPKCSALHKMRKGETTVLVQCSNEAQVKLFMSENDKEGQLGCLACWKLALKRKEKIFKALPL